MDFAYTVDGGPLGELQYETFSAAGAELTFQGRNVHPGTAKDQMVNALQLAIDFHNQLPEADRPEKTEGYQGFYHLMNLTGTVEEAHASYIVRDFETEAFENRKAAMRTIAEKMNQELGSERVILTLKDQYYNMKQVIEKDMTPIHIAKAVMEVWISSLSSSLSVAELTALKFPLWASRHLTSLPAVKTCTAASNMSA